MRTLSVQYAAVMSNQENQNQNPPKTQPLLGEGARALITAAAAFIVLFALKYSRDFAVPIVMAVFLATVSYPLTDFLRRILRFPHWLAVIFSVLVDIVLIFAVASLIKYLAADVVSTLSGSFPQQLADKYTEILATMDKWGIGDQVRELIQSPLSFIDTQYIISLSQLLTGRAISFLALTTLVLILMTFLLGEAPLFKRNFSRMPNSVQNKLKLISALKGIQRYLLIKTIASLCTGLLAWWLCHLTNIPFAFLWGVVAYVLNYVPTIGSIVATTPPILLAFVFGDWSSALIVAGGYLAINSAIGNGIEPLFLGKQFGIATSVVLFSVLIWGWVWGPLGMLLAVPITMFAKLALECSVDLRWVAAFIDDNPSPENNTPDTQQ